MEVGLARDNSCPFTGRIGRCDLGCRRGCKRRIGVIVISVIVVNRLVAVFAMVVMVRRVSIWHRMLHYSCGSVIDVDSPSGLTVSPLMVLHRASVNVTCTVIIASLDFCTCLIYL